MLCLASPVLCWQRLSVEPYSHADGAQGHAGASNHGLCSCMLQEDILGVRKQRCSFGM